jgi:hypothetical protein
MASCKKDTLKLIQELAETAKPNLSDLPDEILLEIISCMGLEDRVKLAPMSKRMNRLTKIANKKTLINDIIKLDRELSDNMLNNIVTKLRLTRYRDNAIINLIKTGYIDLHGLAMDFVLNNIRNNYLDPIKQRKMEQIIHSATNSLGKHHSKYLHLLFSDMPLDDVMHIYYQLENEKNYTYDSQSDQEYQIYHGGY